jgi:hypothetical protein
MALVFLPTAAATSGVDLRAMFIDPYYRSHRHCRTIFICRHLPANVIFIPFHFSWNDFINVAVDCRNRLDGTVFAGAPVRNGVFVSPTCCTITTGW